MFILIILVINVLKIINFHMKISNAHHKQLHVIDFIYFDERMMPGVIKKIFDRVDSKIVYSRSSMAR